MGEDLASSKGMSLVSRMVLKWEAKMESRLDMMTVASSG
jgi:hypothetical protein